MSLHEVQLTPEEKDRVLAICGERALLVGGQALAVWAQLYSVVPVGELSQAVTVNVEYIGPADVARSLWKALGAPWQLRVATLDDTSPQTAKVFAVVDEEGLKQIDFLSGIAGLVTERIAKRAPLIELGSGRNIRILHPLDVLESRLRNLDVLPAKQNPIGVAQARLAIEVVRKFMLSQLSEGTPPRAVFKAIQEVRRIALDSRLVRVACQWKLDVLAAVPADRISAPAFTDRMWPTLVAEVDEKREKHLAALAPRSTP